MIPSIDRLFGALGNIVLQVSSPPHICEGSLHLALVPSECVVRESSGIFRGSFESLVNRRCGVIHLFFSHLKKLPKWNDFVPRVLPMPNFVQHSTVSLTVAGENEFQS